MKEKENLISLQIPFGKTYSIYEYSYLKSFEDRIYYSTGDNQLRIDLLEKINSSFEKDYSESLAGDIVLEHLLTNEELASKIKDLLKTKVNSHSGNSVADISITHNKEYDIWINRMKANEYNPAHYHGGLLSWIWYIDIPEEINKEIGTRGIVEFKSCRTNELMKFNPSTNDFFMFTSNHMHTVYPFRSDVTRISLAGNIQGMIYQDGRIDGSMN